MERGDESSFSILYNNHVDDLFSYGVSLGFEEEICKDAIQDTFCKLYVSRNNLRLINNITAYIFKSFKHRLIDLSRKSAKEEALDSVSESFSIQVTVLDDIIDDENAVILQKKVESLLGGLSPAQREVVYLRYMIGLGFKEIADVLDIREDSTRRLLCKAMGKMRRQVSGENFREALGLLSMLFIR